MIPGEYVLSDTPILCNRGREAIEIEVINTGDRPVQIGSHYHFAEVNPLVTFDRVRARGMRLDIPAGTAARLEPGDATTVRLIPFAGGRLIRGFRNEINGAVESCMVSGASEPASGTGETS
ncbi:urease, beta subunit [Corynebacterium efficiens YS-314]|uniref:Urease subunit beta n=1 Tax=Corynebacterium efficiens (strain DSM 44549 / YS-314 / AJ 12310 / JCM 11189 / NBRC 100395) TaxID=196164 RepID=URE2_COREF|nr:urease subunit beta [Corynebacterium efficiens]Q8FQX3.1 RecName: Full=Urease subunit beta; AltName: Full=Urea amidohydrolase subunit beta [Corynebacterium efficiens YS-314]EEW49874.1 urease, beta subunit [Corynebacterium efficiens YS-314]BAC17804.1 urease beta subunit [Corynebacterium efficiens YS-314]